MLPPVSSLLLIFHSILAFPVAQSVSVFGRCSLTTPCDAPNICVDNIICLPPEAPTPVFAAAPFSLPRQADSPLVLALPEGLLHQNAPQNAIFLPPARIHHPPPEFRPLTRVFPVISRVVGDPVLGPTFDAPQPQSQPKSPSFRSYITPPERQEEAAVRHSGDASSPLFFPPSFSPPQQAPASPAQEPQAEAPSSYVFPPAFAPSSQQSDSVDRQLSLPTARQISIDEVMEERLPKPKPIVASFKSFPPAISPSPISTDFHFHHPMTAPRIPAPSPIVADPQQHEPIIKFADARWQATAVAARNPQALPGGECEPSTECTGGSECVGGICLCPEYLVHQGTVCVLRALYPGIFN